MFSAFPFYLRNSFEHTLFARYRNIALTFFLRGTLKSPSKGKFIIIWIDFRHNWVISLILPVSFQVKISGSLFYTNQKNGISLTKTKCVQTDCGHMRIKSLPTLNIRIKNTFIKV